MGRNMGMMGEQKRRRERRVLEGKEQKRRGERKEKEKGKEERKRIEKE